ncbi:MAG: METTL5 family protein [Candidatus Bathyarchaeia archaeon]
MQKRLVRKLDLELALSNIEPHPSPQAYLEQYTITTEVAAELLYIAAYTYNDIIGKTIADLGCGTGRLAIGAVLLGAEETVGVDVDKIATKTAIRNARRLGVKTKTQWITTDIATLHGNFDTVIQNPPFGVQKPKADRKFLEKALEIGKTIYSLHKSSEVNRKSKTLRLVPSPFLNRFIESHGGEIKAVHTMPMIIPHMFNFHRKPKHQFLADLYVIKTRLNF